MPLTEHSEALRGEAPRALLVEGALSPINCLRPGTDCRTERSEALRGEAPRALLVEGALSPINCVATSPCPPLLLLRPPPYL